eukprot:gene9679-9837_t
MAPLIALARNALPPDLVANSSADPCDLAAAPTDAEREAVVAAVLASNASATASGAKFWCNAQRRIEGILLESWHLSTSGEVLNTEGLDATIDQMHTGMAFPEGLGAMCRLQHLQALWITSLTETSIMARQLSELWTSHQMGESIDLRTSKQYRPSLVDVGSSWRAFYPAGSSTVTGDNMLPGCLSQLSELVALRLQLSTNLPLQLPPAWGRLQKLQYLSISNHYSTNDLGNDLTVPGNISSRFGCGLALPPKGYSAWASQCQARVNTNTSLSSDCFGNSCLGVHKLLCAIDLEGCAGHAGVTGSLSGTLPAEYAGMSSLHTLRLMGHNLNGTLPAEWAEGMINLRTLALSKNKFHGPIPKQWLHGPQLYISANKQHWASTLVDIGLRCNQLTGHLPTDLSGLPQLRRLRLQANQLSGQVPFVLPPSLLLLHLQHNDFTGPVPCFQKPTSNFSGSSSNLGQALNQESPGHSQGQALALTSVFLDNNMLSGTLPSCLSSGPDSATPNLYYLHLQYQRTSQSRVKAIYAAALQQSAKPACTHNTADQLNSNVTTPGTPDSSQLCQAAEAAAAAVALSKLSIHGTIPPALMAIPMLDLTGLALSGPLPEPVCAPYSHASDSDCYRIALDREQQYWSAISGQSVPSSAFAFFDIQAAQQLTGGFESTTSTAWLAAACSGQGKGTFSFKQEQHKQQHNIVAALTRGSDDEITFTIQYGKDSSRQHLESISWDPLVNDANALRQELFGYDYHYMG